MPVSIKDIAREANVSYSTVSRALSDNPRLKPETRERIQRLAAEMGYSPSAVARSLVTNRTHTIGIIATTMTDLFQAEVVWAVEQRAISHDYSVILTQSGRQSEREFSEIEALRERRVDGIILISVRACGPYASLLQGSGIPLVFVNDPGPTGYGHSVRVDNLDGARQAVQHLLDLGHCRIAYISGPRGTWGNTERLAGYTQTLHAAGIAPNPDLIVSSAGQPTDGVRAMQGLLRLPSPPTAVFCYDDGLALGAIRGVFAAGLHVPRDVSVVGFDDIELAPFFQPPLTTIVQAPQELGEHAVETVIALLAGEDVPRAHIIPSRLAIRSSTAPPAA